MLITAITVSMFAANPILADGYIDVRVELFTQGGALPIAINLQEPAPGEGGLWTAGIVNDGNDHPLDAIGSATVVESDAVLPGGLRWEISFDAYDSKLVLDFGLTEFGYRGIAQWIKPRPAGDVVVWGQVAGLTGPGPTRGLYDSPSSLGKSKDLSGRWRVNFEHSDIDAVAVFGQVDGMTDAFASGTVMTTTGDYRELKGRVLANRIMLSTFDGAHAFQLIGSLKNDGTLQGTFTSGNWWHETWTAVRDDDYQLPDPFGLTTVTDENFADLSFPDLDGKDRTIGEFLEEGPTVIEVFGSWCPNCTDASDLLAEYVQTYEGLNVLGLAVEFGKDHETNASRVRKHLSHHEASWPVLIASTTIDKAEATTELGFLDKVRSYPTLIFVDDGEVQAVYTGFNGPATGPAHAKMREDFERIITNMLRD